MLSVMLLFFQSTYCLGDYRLIWLFSPVPRKSHYPIITVLENYQPNESPRIFLGVVRCPRSQLTRAKCHNQKNDRVRPWEGGREGGSYLSESWSGKENEVCLPNLCHFCTLFHFVYITIVRVLCWIICKSFTSTIHKAEINYSWQLEITKWPDSGQIS